MSWERRSGVIVADTGAMLALVDADDAHHATMAALFEADPGAWVLPWAILPEVDYLLATRVGEAAAAAVRRDFSPLRLRGNPKLYPRDLSRAG